MTRLFPALTLTLTLTLLLASCGIDGAPARPDAIPADGLTLSGDARIGVVTQ